VNKGFLSKSTPDILLDDAPTKLNRYPSFADSEPPFVFHTSASAVELSVHDQIAAILGTFPQVSYREASEEDPMLQTSTAVVHTPRRFPSSSEESSEQDNNESHTYQSTGGVGTVLLETTIWLKQLPLYNNSNEFQLSYPLTPKCSILNKLTPQE